MAEFAYSAVKIRQDCRSLGRKFIEHWNKLYADIQNKNFKLAKHHCQEMQTWWNDIKNLKYKHNKKVVTDEELYDSFFTCGQFSEDFIKDKQSLDVYESKLIPVMLLDRNRSLFNIVDHIFNINLS